MKRENLAGSATRIALKVYRSARDPELTRANTSPVVPLRGPGSEKRGAVGLAKRGKKKAAQSGSLLDRYYEGQLELECAADSASSDLGDALPITRIRIRF